MDKKKRVALLTGGSMTHCAVSVANGLGRAGVEVNVVTSPEFSSYPLDSNVHVLPFRRSGDINRSIEQKILDMIIYYYRLLKFLLLTEIVVFEGV